MNQSEKTERLEEKLLKDIIRYAQCEHDVRQPKLYILATYKQLIIPWMNNRRKPYWQAIVVFYEQHHRDYPHQLFSAYVRRVYFRMVFCVLRLVLIA